MVCVLILDYEAAVEKLGSLKYFFHFLFGLHREDTVVGLENRGRGGNFFLI